MRLKVVGDKVRVASNPTPETINKTSWASPHMDYMCGKVLTIASIDYDSEGKLFYIIHGWWVAPEWAEEVDMVESPIFLSVESEVRQIEIANKKRDDNLRAIFC